MTITNTPERHYLSNPIELPLRCGREIKELFQEELPSTNKIREISSRAFRCLGLALALVGSTLIVVATLPVIIVAICVNKIFKSTQSTHSSTKENLLLQDKNGAKAEVSSESDSDQSIHPPIKENLLLQNKNGVGVVDSSESDSEEHDLEISEGQKTELNLSPPVEKAKAADSFESVSEEHDFEISEGQETELNSSPLVKEAEVEVSHQSDAKNSPNPESEGKRTSPIHSSMRSSPLQRTSNSPNTNPPSPLSLPSSPLKQPGNIFPLSSPLESSPEPTPIETRSQMSTTRSDVEPKEIREYQLREYPLEECQLIEIPGDGNCLFAAVTGELKTKLRPETPYFNKLRPFWVRAQAVDWLQANWEDHPFIKKNFNVSDLTLLEAREHLQQNIQGLQDLWPLLESDEDRTQALTTINMLNKQLQTLQASSLSEKTLAKNHFENMVHSGCWGTNIELYALAQRFQVTIQIWIYNLPPPNRSSIKKLANGGEEGRFEVKNPKAVINLLYTGNHYNRFILSSQ